MGFSNTFILILFNLKDRIKASGRRRAAPTLKKTNEPTQDIDDDDIFGLKTETVVIRKPSITNKPEEKATKSVESAPKPTESPVKPPAVTKLVEPERKEEPKQKEEVEPAKSASEVPPAPKPTIPPLVSDKVPPPDFDFDLEPDLFASKPKPTPSKAAAETKPKSSAASAQPSFGSFMPPPDTGDDDELFNIGPTPLTSKEKPAKKTTDILFPSTVPDDDDIFSDMNILNLRKKEPAKPKAAEEKPVPKKTTPAKPTSKSFSIKLLLFS